MTEYERLKEEIIATAAGYTGDIKALTTRLMTIIAERCYLKTEERDLSIMHIRNEWLTSEELEYIKQSTGWRPVVEIKKEE